MNETSTSSAGRTKRKAGAGEFTWRRGAPDGSPAGVWTQCIARQSLNKNSERELGPRRPEAHREDTSLDGGRTLGEVCSKTCSQLNGIVPAPPDVGAMA